MCVCACACACACAMREAWHNLFSSEKQGRAKHEHKWGQMNSARLGSFGNERLGNITQRSMVIPPTSPFNARIRLTWGGGRRRQSVVGALLTYGPLQPPCGDSIIVIVIVIVTTNRSHKHPPTGEREDDSCECLLLLCVAHCVSFLGCCFLCLCVGCMVECFLHCLCALCA